MTDIPSLAGDAVQARLTAVEGLPAEIWRNRGRMGVWKEIAVGNPNAGFAAINVMDGDARATEWMLAHPDMEVEVEQELLIDFLVYHPKDADRTALYRTGLQKITDAILPPGASGQRERTLGGLVDEIELERVERQGLVLDVTPHLIGASLVFRFSFTAGTVLG